MDQIGSFAYAKDLILSAANFGASGDINADLLSSSKLNDNDEDAKAAWTTPSVEYEKMMSKMDALSRQLQTDVNDALLTASVESKMLHSLEQYGDPMGDNETDILERVEKYSADFLSRVGHRKLQMSSDNAAEWSMAGSGGVNQPPSASLPAEWMHYYAKAAPDAADSSATNDADDSQDKNI